MERETVAIIPNFSSRQSVWIDRHRAKTVILTILLLFGFPEEQRNPYPDQYKEHWNGEEVEETHGLSLKNLTRQGVRPKTETEKQHDTDKDEEQSNPGGVCYYPVFEPHIGYTTERLLNLRQ